MPTLITTQPRTADPGKPRIVMNGGGAGGLELHQEWKVSKKQNVRAVYSQPSLLFVYPSLISNTIASSFYTYIGKQKRYLNHLVESTPRLAQGIAGSTSRNTQRYLRQTGVNVYEIGNVSSGKTPKIIPGKKLNLHARINRLVWKFTLKLSVTNFLDKLLVRTGLTSYNKSNRIIIARLKGCAL
jgi:NADH dehydrogenase FAD-containing subunit